MLPTTIPLPVYCDLAGAPIDGGYVWFGLPNLNPETSPITVYWDRDGTQPAAQPLRTVNGYILRNGQAANVYCDVEYSVTIRDRARRLVRYAETSLDFDEPRALRAQLAAPAGSDLPGFQQLGGYASTVGSKLKQTLTNLDFLPVAERAAVILGNSTYDATADMQEAINLAGSTQRLRWIGTVNCGLLSSAASVDWIFEGGAKIKQIPAVYGLSNYHVTLTGPRVRLENVELDGNQDNMTVGQGSMGLLVTGVSSTIIGLNPHDYNGVGYVITSQNIGVKRSINIGCNIDDNAGLGMQTSAACYIDFLGCTFDRNGYGFKKTRANYADVSHGFVGFGFALRMRSHHITFTQCQARDNGRDGMNVNQGSYAIKFSQCLAHGNDDGGFTIASDNTGSGLPGEGEACYDIEYTDCEAYNNYTCGLVAYQACHNVTVSGGRYYNNHRIAGNQATAASFYNGIYIAGGSSGIHIDTKVYDERQFRVITAVGGLVLTATGWVAGCKDFYPKVAIYSGVDQSFRGYASIAAEAAGSVTISPTTFNGVNPAAILVGDYVTQAVQHNGVFTDNNCQGIVIADGAGHHLGASASTSGRLVLSGGFASGQCILMPRARLSETNLLTNGTFDVNTAGWAYNLPGGGSQTQVTGAFARSAGALQLVGGSSPATADATLVTNALTAMNHEFIEFGAWVWASARADAYLQIIWVIGASTLNTICYHPGGGWKYLRVCLQIPDTTSAVVARLSSNTGKTTRFDSATLRGVEAPCDSRDFDFPSRNLPL